MDGRKLLIVTNNVTEESVYLTVDGWAMTSKKTLLVISDDVMLKLKHYPKWAVLLAKAFQAYLGAKNNEITLVDSFSLISDEEIIKAKEKNNELNEATIG